MSVVVVPFPSHPLHPSHNSSLQSTKGLALLNEIRRGNGDCGGQADVRQALKILITMRRLQQMRGGNGGSINLRSRGEVLAGIFDGIGFFFWFFFFKRHPKNQFSLETIYQNWQPKNQR